MRVHLRFLRKREMVQAAMIKAGWELEPEPDNCVMAMHPLVQDEVSARGRLQQLGLLTTSSLSIEFIRSTGRRNSIPS